MKLILTTIIDSGSVNKGSAKTQSHYPPWYVLNVCAKSFPYFCCMALCDAALSPQQKLSYACAISSKSCKST